MKKKLLYLAGLTAFVMAMLLTVSFALAEDAYEVSDFESWLAQKKSAAKSADHILGPDDVDTIQKRSLTIILPGETIAVVPDAAYSRNSIQGGINSFGFSIIQLNEPEVNTTFLYAGHTAEKTTFTEVKTDSIRVPYGKDAYEGATQADYVSLYRNDTGYPVIVRGHHAGSRSNIYTKTSESMQGRSFDGATTLCQMSGYFCYAPVFYFVEPTYQIKVRSATGSGIPYEWPVANPTKTLTIYMDHSDHTYELDNPAIPGCRFKNWVVASGGLDFPISTDGTISGNKTTFVFNMQKRLWEKADATGSGLKYYATDAELAVEHFTGSSTVRFHAGDGTINGLKTLLVEAEINFKMADYQAIRSGYNFLGWCSDESNPTGTLLKGATSDNRSEWFSGTGGNMDVYAAWDNSTEVKKSGGIYTIKDGKATFTAPMDKNAKSLKILDKVDGAKVTAVAADACKGMSKLTKVTIGKNVTTIGKNAFASCAKLKTVSLGSGVTTIGQAAFKGDKALTKITLPAKVKSIGKQAFMNCAKLKTITIKTTKLTSKSSSVGSNAFKGTPASVTVKCPASKLEEYQKILVKKGISKSADFKK